MFVAQGTEIDEAFGSLQKDNHLSKKLHIVFYGASNLQEKILDFIRSLDQGSLRDLFNIKYTLRVSGKINDYLNWKAKKVDTRKADWLRDRIQDIMKSDSDYQKYLQDRYKLSK